MQDVSETHVLISTNNVDFIIVNKSDILLFSYDRQSRHWYAIMGMEKTRRILLSSSLTSESILQLSPLYAQVNKSTIINIRHLQRVKDGHCHFLAPFDGIEGVRLSRFYRQSLMRRFCRI